MADALRSGRSELTLVWVQVPPSAPLHALVAQWIERSPAEAEAVGSSPTQRATTHKEAVHLGRPPSPSSMRAQRPGLTHSSSRHSCLGRAENQPPSGQDKRPGSASALSVTWSTFVFFRKRRPTSWVQWQGPWASAALSTDAECLGYGLAQDRRCIATCLLPWARPLP